MQIVLIALIIVIQTYLGGGEIIPVSPHQATTPMSENWNCTDSRHLDLISQNPYIYAQRSKVLLPSPCILCFSFCIVVLSILGFLYFCCFHFFFGQGGCVFWGGTIFVSWSKAGGLPPDPFSPLFGCTPKVKATLCGYRFGGGYEKGRIDGRSKRMTTFKTRQFHITLEEYLLGCEE